MAGWGGGGVTCWMDVVWQEDGSESRAGMTPTNIRFSLKAIDYISVTIGVEGNKLNCVILKTHLRHKFSSTMLIKFTFWKQNIGTPPCFSNFSTTFTQVIQFVTFPTHNKSIKVIMVHSKMFT